jgi:hypothetical protein
VRRAKYLESLRRYYNHNVKDKFFVVDDFGSAKETEDRRIA